MEDLYAFARLKSAILAGATVELSKSVLENHKPAFDNHHHTAWIFLKLTKMGHVRLTAVDKANHDKSVFF